MHRRRVLAAQSAPPFPKPPLAYVHTESPKWCSRTSPIYSTETTQGSTQGIHTTLTHRSKATKTDQEVEGVM